MRKTLLTTLLVVLMFLSSGTVVEPALQVDLDAYARAIANNVVNAVGPQQNWAQAQASFAGPPGNCASVSDVYVQRVGGMAWGPMGGWLWLGIGAIVWGWPPPGINGHAYAEGWFESDGAISPLTISTKGAVCRVKDSGSRVSDNRLGITVTDGGIVIYDVAVEYGWGPVMGTYFRVIQAVGTWPAPWQIVGQNFYNLTAVLPPFAIPLFPAGLAKAKLYSNVLVWAKSGPFVAQDGSNLQQDEVSGYFEALPCDTTIDTLAGGLISAYPWRNPSRHGDRFLAESFRMPLDHGGRLEKLDISFYQTGSTGTPDPDFYIWLSDGIYPLDNNPPYQAIAEFQIANSDIVWYPGMTTVETYSYGLTLDPGEMFHIGFGHAYDPEDTLIVLSDGSNNSNRSVEWTQSGQWSTLLANWGKGVDFMINAYICPFAPKESTFVISCEPPCSLASPGDVNMHVFDVTITQIMNYPIAVTLNLLSVTPLANITATFSPNPVTPPGTADALITVDVGVSYGDYTLTFQGVGYDNQTKTCNVTLRVQPPFDEAVVNFNHGLQRISNFGAVGNDQQSPAKTKNYEFMEKTSKFQAVSKQGNFVWYGTNYLLDGSFISAVPGTPQKDYMALDVYNCEHVGFLPTQHIVMTHDPWCPGTAYEEDYGEVAFANFYTEENVISCEHDSLFVIGLSDVVCTDFSEMIKISYNPTATPIPLLYQDLFEDWDISAGGLNDWGDMDTLHNIMYQYDPANPSLVFGMFKAPFYNDRMYNMTFVNGPQYVWPTQGFCSGWGLDSLWYLMTRPGYFYPSGSHTDFSMLMCSQPISLNPGDKHMEVWINFGKNLNDGMTWSQWYHKILRYVGFYRGDVNASDTLEVPAMDISDLVYLFNYLYQAGPAPQPFIDQGNVDGKGPYGGPVDTVCPKNNVDIQDLVYLVNYVFKSGPAPVDYVRFIPSFWSRPSLFLNPNW